MGKISVLMLGTSGYALGYLQELLHEERGKRFELIGAVDPYAQNGKMYGDLVERGIPIYDTVEEFYAEHTADVAFIVTPIYLHAYQAIYCMEHGSDVLCEKPICATLADARAMMEARDRTGRKLAIGFQWSFAEGILSLKQDILNGVYGKVKRIRTRIMWPRNLDYYGRGSGWAGKRRLASGEWVFDSVAANATAHYLHNMLFLTGHEIARSAEVASLTAEVYQVNQIEMFDTCALRLYTKDGVELVFLATHASEDVTQPDFVLEGEKGTVTFRQENGEKILEGQWADGRVISYLQPDIDPRRKLYCMADAITEDKPLSCVAETVLPHLECINTLAELFPVTPRIPDEFIRFLEGNRQYVCTGIEEIFEQCYQEGKLPYEIGAAWAQKPKEKIFN